MLRETPLDPPLVRGEVIFAALQLTVGRSSHGATRRFVCGVVGVALMAVVGCTAISIQPSCPKQLDVGETGGLSANQLMPGAVPTYLWTVEPATAGTITDPTLPDTDFTAAREGTARFVLTASDGLFQVISFCESQIGSGSGVAVSLSASSSTVVIGDTVTLTCTSTGSVEATTFVIDQVQGATIELNQVSSAAVSFAPSAEGVPRFQCVGQDANGVASDAVFVNITVNAASTGGGGGVVRR